MFITTKSTFGKHTTACNRGASCDCAELIDQRFYERILMDIKHYLKKTLTNMYSACKKCDIYSGGSLTLTFILLFKKMKSRMMPLKEF